MIERIGFGLYQSCENGESVGPVFGLRWYGGVGVGGGGWVVGQRAWTRVWRGCVMSV